jgi:hypothetical protein
MKIEDKDIKPFVRDFLIMTNKEVFDFISEYKEVPFFLTLAEYLEGMEWSTDLYFNISHAYYRARHYFETH